MILRLFWRDVSFGTTKLSKNAIRAKFFPQTFSIAMIEKIMDTDLDANSVKSGVALAVEVIEEVVAA